ncbi:hypothetical protein X946_4919 [Burkholderia sp. ABCPW 111]|nr:hypothetical protein X946_4919 [Burkholderia sp. ABCPW 111]
MRRLYSDKRIRTRNAKAAPGEFVPYAFVFENLIRLHISRSVGSALPDTIAIRLPRPSRAQPGGGASGIDISCLNIFDGSTARFVAISDAALSP